MASLLSPSRPAPPLPITAAAAADATADLVARLAAGDDATLALQLEAASIPAPTGGEDARAVWFARALLSRGATTVERDAAGNVIARFPGQRAAAPVVVLSHLDTVCACDAVPTIRRDGDRYVGRGINDNARGLAAAVVIAGELAAGRHPTRRPIVLVGTTGEEGAGDLRGAKHFFAHDATAHCAIALDGAGDDRIVHRALGSRRFRVVYDGPGGHSWAAFGAPNAVHAAAACTMRLARLRMPATPRATLTVSRVGGGTSINAIPEVAWIEVDARSPDAATVAWMEREVHRAVRAGLAEENGRRAAGSPVLSASVERLGDRPSGATPAGAPLVEVAAAATRAIGRRPELALASTDANVPMSLGIPAIAIGAGGCGGDAHTEQEWYRNVEGPRGIARALAIIVAAANL